jgi:hypothetical protein
VALDVLEVIVDRSDDRPRHQRIEPRSLDPIAQRAPRRRGLVAEQWTVERRLDSGPSWRRDRLIILGRHGFGESANKPLEDLVPVREIAVVDLHLDLTQEDPGLPALQTAVEQQAQLVDVLSALTSEQRHHRIEAFGAARDRHRGVSREPIASIEQQLLFRAGHRQECACQQTVRHRAHPRYVVAHDFGRKLVEIRTTLVPPDQLEQGIRP